MFWKKKKRLVANITGYKCKNCGNCVKRCRRNALTCTEIQDKTCTFVNYPERCTGCGKCAAVCPSRAIEMIERYC
ncbi:MAG: 4Fe-4S binding protein [Prevotella sp.]|jgi:ferredoxin|nr:4Fe-4S binding protein [Prevotella sp.]